MRFGPALVAPGFSLGRSKSLTLGLVFVGRRPRLEACRAGLRGLEGLPDARGGEGQVELANAEGGDGVEDGVDDGGRGADGAGLADAFDAERVVRRRGHGQVELEVGQHVGVRDGVVEQTGGQELAVFVADDALVERLADALGQAAGDLAVDDQRVDDGAAVVDGDQALEADVAAVEVDADNRHGRAERDRVLARVEPSVGLEAALAVRQAEALVRGSG
jgi:hypothetical protein